MYIFKCWYNFCKFNRYFDGLERLWLNSQTSEQTVLTVNLRSILTQLKMSIPFWLNWNDSWLFVVTVFLRFFEICDKNYNEAMTRECKEANFNFCFKSKWRPLRSITSVTVPCSTNFCFQNWRGWHVQHLVSTEQGHPANVTINLLRAVFENRIISLNSDVNWGCACNNRLDSRPVGRAEGRRDSWLTEISFREKFGLSVVASHLRSAYWPSA